MRRLLVGALMALGVAAGSAPAEPGLSNQVYAPYVRRGVTEIEVRAGRLLGGPSNGEQAQVIEVERGVSNRLNLALLAEFETPAGGENRLDALAVEAVAYLGQIPGVGVDVGGYLEFEQRVQNESAVLEGKLLLARRFGAFEGRLNLAAARPLSHRPGQDVAAYGYAAQGTWDVGRGAGLGLQAFGDLGTDRAFGGRQSHYLGPVATLELRPAWLKGGEFELEAAYLLPIAAARRDADSQIRFAVSFERRF